jgi:hypothetical protein
MEDFSDTSSAKTANSVPQEGHLCWSGEMSSPQNGHSNLTSLNDAPHLGQLGSPPETVLPQARHPNTKAGADESSMA